MNKTLKTKENFLRLQYVYDLRYKNKKQKSTYIQLTKK
jgi:hypothetical protein